VNKLFLLIGCLFIFCAFLFDTQNNIAKFHTQVLGCTLITANDCQRPSVAKLATNKLVVAYDEGVTAVSRVGTYTQNGAVTWGSVSTAFSDDCEVTTSDSAGPVLCVLDTDKFLVAYVEDASADDLYATECTVSGTTVNLGTEKEIANTDAEWMDLVCLTPSTAVCVFNDETNSDTASAVLINTTNMYGLSNSLTIDLDSASVDYYPARMTANKVADNQFIYAFRATDISSHGHIGSSTTSGLGLVSKGTIVKYIAETTSWHGISMLNSTQGMVATNGGGLRQSFFPFTLSGTTITMGAELSADITGGSFLSPYCLNNNLAFSVVANDYGKALQDIVLFMNTDMANRQIKSVLEKQELSINQILGAQLMVSDIAFLGDNLYAVAMVEATSLDAYLCFIRVET